MKRFFTKTGIWLLAAAAIIAVVLCVVSSLSSGTGLLHNALGVIASPFRSAGAAVTEWVGGIGDRFESVEALQQENEELRAYIAGGEPMDKAGAYGVQGQGALLVERIDGDFFNVMGLPVVLLSEMLKEFGVTLLG